MIKLTVSSDFFDSLNFAKKALIQDGWIALRKDDKTYNFVNKAIKTKRDARERLGELELLICATLTIRIEEVSNASIPSEMGLV